MVAGVRDGSAPEAVLSREGAVLGLDRGGGYTHLDLS